jgi:signal transduction histidine kinase
MPSFYLQPLSFILLSGLILTVFLTGYLATIREKRRDLRILFVYLLAYTTFLAIGWLVYTVVAEWRVYLIALLFLFIAITVTGFVHFAYAFLENPFKREMRVVLTILISGTAVYALHVFIQCLSHGQALNVNVTAVPAAAMLVDVWVFILLVRKTLRLERDAHTRVTDAGEPEQDRATGGAPRGFLAALVTLRRAESNHARAHRALLAVSATHIILRVEAALWAAGYLPFSLHVTLFYSLELVFLSMLVWVYVSYSPQPTTFRVKLVGLTLATTLLFTGIGGSYFYSADDLDALGAGLLPSPRTIRFEPLSGGGYRVRTLPLNSSSVEKCSGAVFRLDGQGDPCLPLALPFAFPYAGRRWDTLHISRFGTVSFGDCFLPNLSSDFRTLALSRMYPRITPMLYSNNERMTDERTHMAADSHVVAITWDGARMSNSLYPGGRSKPSRFRLLLFHDGSIQWDYIQVNMHGIAELSPGGASVPVAMQGSVIGVGHSYRVDYLLRYRMLVHRTTLPILFLLLAAAFFIVVFLPWLYGTSLVKPLDALLHAVHSVNAGRLDVVVPVHSSDEIGTLSSTFNVMTRTLRESERQLKEYAETLEQKVHDRTAALHQSLEQLTKTQSQLIQTEKMASLGQLTAGIAHEIKNPLNFVVNFSTLSREMIEQFRQASEESERDELLADITRNLARVEEHARRADAIIRSMMRHASKGGTTRQPTDLNALLDETATLAYHGMKAGTEGFHARLEKDFDPALPRISIIPQDLSRVFLNIIQNGLYAAYTRSADQSEASDAAGDAPHPPLLLITTRLSGEHVEIRIRDNGNGIPDAIRDRIYQPFFTTKPAGVGTGLGLYLSFEIVTAHGGTLSVESREGQFTEFTVTLPA